MKSRTGSYKKILIEADTLKIHHEFLRINLLALKDLKLSEYLFTTLYILLFLRIKHPKNWLQKKNQEIVSIGNEIPLLELIPESFKLNDWEKNKLDGVSAFSLFNLFHLKAIPESINRTMNFWYLGNWNIKMLEYIPTPRELLLLQVKNSRCVTLITDPTQISSLVMESRDPLSFVLHDLMHADQFFSQIESQKGQLGFYQLIMNIYNRPELRALLKENKDFKKEFEYVTTDMNAYVIHLFKCFKSSIYRIDPDLFENILQWWNMSEEEKHSSLSLNSPHFTEKDEFLLRIFFERNQEII